MGGYPARMGISWDDLMDLGRNNPGDKGCLLYTSVSPAGGNLKEPVTENTKKVARCFYALEQDRADKKRYPAVNPAVVASLSLSFLTVVVTAVGV